MMGSLVRIAAIALVVLLAAAAVWVRLAPIDPAAWHTDPVHGTEGPNSDVSKTFIALPPAEALAALDAVALAYPRTRRIAGSPEEGRITYVTRSAVWGFPDFTTVAAVEDEGGAWLVIHARSRFGGYDWGVNASRVAAWLAALGAGG
jgi:uncharacterized protein (DUF1499 family)